MVPLSVSPVAFPTPTRIYLESRTLGAIGLLLLLVLASTWIPASRGTVAPPHPLSPLANPYFEVNYTLGSPVTGTGYGDAFDPATGDFYVVNSSNAVKVVNESKWTAVGNLTVTSGRYAHIAMDPVHALGFVNGGAAQNVTIFNTSTLTVVRTLVVTGGSGIAVDPLHEVVMFDNGNDITLYDYGSGRFLYNITVGTGTLTSALAFDPGAGWIAFPYQSAGLGAVLGIVNETTQRWVTNVSISGTPIGIAYDPGGKDFVVGCGSQVSVVQLVPAFSVQNYTIPSPAQNAIGVSIINGGADEALLWTYENAGGATLIPFDISRGVFLPSVLYSSNAWPAAIAVDPRTLAALAVDPLTGDLAPYLPTLTGRQSVSFTETGLLGGTDWCMSLNATSQCSTSTVVSYDEKAGSYSYTVGGVAGYTVTPTSGSVSVLTAPVSVSVTYTPKSSLDHAVNFTESGLPAGTNWSVTFNWATRSTTGTTDTFSAPNGSYAYSVGSVPGYTANPSSGVVTVNGAAVVQTITFSVFSGPKYWVNFTESGLPAGTLWSIDLGGANSASATTTIAYSLGNGTYSFTVGTVTGYRETPSSGTITVAGKPVSTLVQFTPIGVTTYNISYVETGLPVGTTWSVTQNGSKQSAAISTIVFIAPKGSYFYTIPNVAGYAPVPFSGYANVTNGNVTVPVTFSLVASKWTVSFNEVGLAPGTPWWVVLAGTNVTSVNPTVSFLEPNGNYAFSVGASGYTPFPAVGSVSVAGANVTQSIQFTTATPPTFSVTFSETGLSTGTSWAIALQGTTHYASAPSAVTFLEPNATYTYSVPGVTGYSANPTSGTITVSGPGAGATIAFTVQSGGAFPVTFDETGVPSGTAWWVWVHGSTNQTSTTPSMTLVLTNGNYQYSTGSTPSYQPNQPNGQFSVSGQATTVYITFFAIPPGSYLVDFLETGLPSGTSWSVTLAGITHTSTTASDVFYEINGSWSYSLGTVTGYQGSPNPGTVQVAGSGQTVYITFATVTHSVGQTTGSASLLTGWGMYLLWAVGIAVAGVVAAVATRPKHPPMGP